MAKSKTMIIFELRRENYRLKTAIKVLKTELKKAQDQGTA